MQRITPHLWYDTEAREASEFYCSVFPDSQVTNVTTLHDTPSGDCDVVSFRLWGQDFMAISAGPVFRFNPSVSFMVNFGPPHVSETEARERIDVAWDRLSEGGTVLMALDKYPFSDRYGWIQDCYGLSWQLMLTGPDGDPRPPILPSLMFVGDRDGHAAEAIDFYRSVFADSEPGTLARYPQGAESDREGKVMFADFRILDRWLAAMDGGHDHDFTFNEAVSFMVGCEDQAELDGYWEKLSAVPEAEQCGWLKDRFGVSWQVRAKDLDAMMRDGTREQIDRVTQAFLPMKKLDLAVIRRAYEGTD
ncbi:VOC family protein [Longispora fulva]|uniref:Putative 3-demethylubiquinone-9 3-methyltransferase (Glyoxalase superfamily) n=1 Tax=Longispora fulva TaxID=619741 RepID=A0A8J7GBU5_9ACTN|nr:VOC family protein [Longispora fulva]MBG6135624.1 putative 3-demethylubiquinone-9 3-methyltransferase (glyoxalase superfamily) [Longispora fulva]